MKKKIILVSNIYPSKTRPYRGTFVKNIYEILINGGLDVQLSVLKDNGKGKINKLYLYIVYYIDIIIKSFNRDTIIYVHYISHSAFPIWVVMFLFRKDVIVNIHGSDILGDKTYNKIVNPFVKYILNNCDSIIVPSVYFKNILNDKIVKCSLKIFVSPSGGVDEKIFSYSEIKNHEEYKIITLGYISRLENKKGWEIFINAINRLIQENIIVNGIIVGSGSDEIKIREKITEYKLDNWINIYKGVEQNKLPHFLAKLDLFVFPTLYEESLGLVALEALSMGIPVVATNIGAISEYITNGYNGFTFPKGNYIKLASIIKNYIELDNSNKKLFSLRAYKSSQKYHKSVVGNELVNFMNSRI